MDIEKILQKIGFGIAISMIIVIVLFFNLEQKSFSELILYDVIPSYKMQNFITLKQQKAVLASNIKNTEILGLDDISYEHKKTEGEIKESIKPIETVDPDKLKNLEYLKNRFYIVDTKTALTDDYFNVDKFLSTDVTITKDTEKPKILIFHTHANEMFKDSKKGDLNEGIIGAGTRLKNLLEDEYGINTLHIKDEFDKVDGKVRRNGAYERMEPVITKVLEENPSIELVIDLHRDGVPETTHLVTNIKGKDTAKIMFFNGISRLVENGELKNISNLPNPNVHTNLALSFKMQKEAMEKYSGFTRKIYIKSYRYSLHLLPKTLLIEAGAQTSTKQEIYNAMDILAKIINDVIFTKA